MEFHIKGGIADDGSEKSKRLKKKLDAFSAEMAGEMMEEADIEKLKRVITKNLNNIGVSASLQSMLAFRAGMEFYMMANEDGMGIPSLMGTQFIIAKMREEVEKKMPKV